MNLNSARTFFACMVLPAVLHAQSVQAHGPCEESVLSLAAIPGVSGPSTILAGTEYAGIFHSTDRG